MSPAAASMTYSYFCSDNSYFMNIEELPKYPQLHLEISELIVPYVNYDTGSSAIIEYDQSKKLVFELTINLIQLDFDPSSSHKAIPIFRQLGQKLVEILLEFPEVSEWPTRARRKPQNSSLKKL